MRNYFGTYSGVLDGRNASLEIREGYRDQIRTFEVSLKDLDRNVTYKGIHYVPNINMREHVISNLRLENPNGDRLSLGQLILHTWNTNHLTAVTSNEYGLLFTKGNLASSRTPANKFSNEDSWVGIYKGRWDGRRAALLIRRTPSGGWNISIQDSDRNAYFEGDFSSLPFLNNNKQHLTNLVLGRSGNQVTIGKMLIHTWNTNYISGTSASGGKEYGFYFVRR